jgi:glutathione peroxidase-family protein
MMEKCHANGEESHPIFSYLREALPHRNTTQEEEVPPSPFSHFLPFP